MIIIFFSYRYASSSSSSSSYVILLKLDYHEISWKNQNYFFKIVVNFIFTKIINVENEEEENEFWKYKKMFIFNFFLKLINFAYKCK